MSPRVDVVVIGGGILGLCVAGFLCEAGRDVTIVDSGGADGTTTNAGSLHVQMQSRFMRKYPGQVPALESTLHLYPKAIAFWRDLERKLNVDFELSITGGLMVAESGEQLSFLATKAARERALGLESHMLERSELEQIAPYLGPSIVGAELCTNEGKLNPLKANAALRRWVERSGAQLIRDNEVLGISRSDKGWRVGAHRAVIDARTVVIAAGAGSRELAEGLGMRLPIEAEPLHMNITEPVAHFIDHLIQHADRPITLKQFKAGHVVIGGGWPAALERVRRYPVVRLESLIGNATLAQHVIPAIGPLRLIRTWAGVNTTTDGKSIVGRAHGFDELFFAIPGDAGYTLGPLIAYLAAQAVLGQRSSEDIEPFSVSRFQ
jgi:glycine/D-amino acid oxidase-like deaminating enzyme